MNKNSRPWQWKYLGFILQAAKSARKNKSIVIAHKGSTDSIAVSGFVFGTTSFAACELLPVHGGKNNRKLARACNAEQLSQNLAAEPILSG
jgi:hypothetical protein